MKRILVLGFFVLLLSAKIIDADEIKEYKLSLEEATQLAIKNNFDIQLTKYDALYSKETRGIYESIFDTNLSADINYRNNQNASTVTYAGTKDMTNNYNVGIAKKVPSGTTFSLDMENNRDWTNSSFSTNNLNHNSTLGLSVVQELGKNFFGMKDRGDIKINAIDIENSGYTSNDKIEDTVVEVQKAYWELVLFKEIVKIKEGMLEQAKRLYDLYQEKLKDGLTEIPDVIASEANYKNRINELAISRNQVKLGENVLKLLLNIEYSEAVIEPVENLSLTQFTENNKDALSAAFENRWDYKKANNEIKSEKIQLSLKKNNLWPEINLTASFNKNGLGDHFKQAVTNMSDQDNPDFYAGISVNFPLENTKAKSELNQAEIQKAKAILNLKLIERKIAIGIMDQVRNCKIYKEIAKTSEDVASLQYEKLKEEEKRFNTGRSSTDTLVRYQEDVIQAQETAARNKYQYHISLINLEKIKGTLLKKYIGN